MKLTFYQIDGHEVDLRPNDPTRPWMDETFDSYAYRCLPLNIANAHGWSLHLTESFSVKWDGGAGLDALTFKSETDPDTIQNAIDNVCMSGFGHGIITFYVHGIFRTEPNWNLYISGPTNTPKDGVYPLHGITETDWSPYSFTMNWMVTRPNTWIKFKKGEVFCSVFPVERNGLTQFTPVIAPLSSNPELNETHINWSNARNKFNEDLKQQGSEAVKQKWQKDYFKGQMPDGTKGVEDHQSKLRLKLFEPSED